MAPLVASSVDVDADADTAIEIDDEADVDAELVARGADVTVVTGEASVASGASEATVVPQPASASTTAATPGRVLLTPASGGR